MDDDYKDLLGAIGGVDDRDFDAMRRAVGDWENYSKSIAEAFQGPYGSLHTVTSALQREIQSALSVKPSFDANVVLSQLIRPEQMLGPLYNFDSALKATQDHARAILESAGSPRDFYQSLAPQFRDLTGLFASGQVVINELLRGQVEELSNLKAMQSTWIRQVDVHELKRGLEGIAALARDAADLYLERSDSNVSANIPAIGEDEVNSALEVIRESISPALAKPELPGLMKVLRDLMGAINSGFLKLKPGAQFILANLLIEILGAIVSPLVIPAPENEPPRISKEVRAEVRRLQRTRTEFPSNIRIVLASKLNVRKGPGIKNALVGQLYAGDVVITEKRHTRSWSLIEYRDSDGDVIVRGWVFSRYLEPVNKR